ncbi:MAG: hypothetical protein AAF220_08160 [Pseudomonadota bacterium]
MTGFAGASSWPSNGSHRATVTRREGRRTALPELEASTFWDAHHDIGQREVADIT